MSLTAITTLSRRELADLLGELGEPQYRADQVLTWIYRRYATSFSQMTDLSHDLRSRLEERLVVRSVSRVREETADDGETTKVVLRLADGQTIETVLMLYAPGDDQKARRTVCVSTQVGCPIGCPFCATGQGGFVRNLSAGEIVEQVLYFAGRLAEKRGNRSAAEAPITNVVFMGMGEPLLNFDATWTAVELLNARTGFGLGARHITISTSGVVPGIQRLAAESLQVGLAISLHAASNELRDRLVPLNRRYPLEKLLQACRDYARATGRRVTYEYAMIDHVNDSLGAARDLARLLHGQLCHVNLIALNRVEGTPYAPTPPRRILAFERELQRLGIPVTIRSSRGGGVQAACGQLRHTTSGG
ncbi:MAG: 23S rRNA (adenine(2503)-C(2))-methyltransferase RlmN [Chloroflexota bacterium]|nr:MAG: 23S rRNA (adenine(2503)-C(2))-methyltransferase RlmN [Chloroflexota bacterium]